jgi:cyanate permease
MSIDQRLLVSIPYVVVAVIALAASWLLRRRSSPQPLSYRLLMVVAGAGILLALVRLFRS